MTANKTHPPEAPEPQEAADTVLPLGPAARRIAEFALRFAAAGCGFSCAFPGKAWGADGGG